MRASSRRSHNRFDNLLIAGAAAEIAGMKCFSSASVGLGFSSNSAFEANSMPGVAKAALKSAMLDERFLKRVKFTVVANPSSSIPNGRALSNANVVQALTGRPSTNKVQAAAHLHVAGTFGAGQS